MDMQQLIRNRNEFPHDELDQYAGRYVAWSPDGTRILASDDDPLRLIATVKAAGHDIEETLIESVPFPDEVILGGGLLFNVEDQA